jgi:hypothetical protein
VNSVSVTVAVVAITHLVAGRSVAQSCSIGRPAVFSRATSGRLCIGLGNASNIVRNIFSEARRTDRASRRTLNQGPPLSDLSCEGARFRPGLR